MRCGTLAPLAGGHDNAGRGEQNEETRQSHNESMEE